MATIIRTQSPVAGTTNLAGYFPTLGAANYSARSRGVNLPGEVGQSLATTAVWPNDVGSPLFSVKVGGGQTEGPPKEAFDGLECIGGPAGRVVGMTAGGRAASAQTVALLIKGTTQTGAERRYFLATQGYFVASTSAGWSLGTRDVGGSVVDRGSLDAAVPAANVRFAVLLSTDLEGNVRLVVKKSTAAPAVGEFAAVPRGGDSEFKIGNVVYNSNAGSHQIAHVVNWDRVLAPAEESSVLSALVGLQE